MDALVTQLIKRNYFTVVFMNYLSQVNVNVTNVTIEVKTSKGLK